MGCHALLYCVLVLDQIDMLKSMRNVCRNKSICCRNILFSYFSDPIDTNELPAAINCCDICKHTLG